MNPALTMPASFAPGEDLRLQPEAIAKMAKKERQVTRELIDALILKYEAKRWSSASS